jgi:hypothetical protein
MKNSAIPCLFATAFIIGASLARAQSPTPGPTPRTAYVPDDYATIQAAVDAADTGGEVIVRAGTYTGEGNKNVVFRGKEVTLRSEHGAAWTIIDCENSGRGFSFQSGETSAAVLEGFTITGGGGNQSGGGIYIDGSSPSIGDCVVTACFTASTTVARGGGIYIGTASASAISACRIVDNVANGQGIEVYMAPQVNAQGGGVYIGAGNTCTFADCLIESNSAQGAAIEWATTAGDGSGGGVFCNSTAVVITHCTIRDNTANGGNNYGTAFYAGDGYGGGVWGSPSIINCLISGNSANGGTAYPDIHWYKYQGSGTGGGGLGDMGIKNCTVADNSVWTPGGNGTATYGGISGGTAVNSILWGNTAGQAGGTVTYSDVQGGYAGTGNIDSDPRFYGGNDYRIAGGSPCIDVGDNSAVDWDEDLFGADRIVAGRGVSAIVDMGSCEFAPGGTLHEGFDNFDTGSRPAGWVFTNCNQDSDTFTGSGYYGILSPSLRFDATGDEAVTVPFALSRSEWLTFWIRGVGTDATSSLLVESYSSPSWSTVTGIAWLPQTGTSAGAFAVGTSSTMLRFSFNLSAGVLALDDVWLSAPTPTPVGYKTPIPTPSAAESPVPTPSSLPSASPTPTAVPPTPIIPTPTAVPPTPIPPTPTAAIPTPTAAPTAIIGPTPIRRVFDAADFNGDGADDLGLWRSADASFRIRDISTVFYGVSTDIPITGDYNGDGTADYGVFRPGTLPGSSCRWWVRTIYSGTPYTNFLFGAAGDIPVPADYDGDFRTDTAIWRPANGYWAIKNQTRFYYGANGDQPVPGDYNGDGLADAALFRNAGALSGIWYVRNITKRAWGFGSDAVAPGDYNGDGTTELSVFRGYAGTWYIMGSPTVSFGQADDIPVVIDYEGDGTSDRVLYRPSEGNWYIYGVTTINYGISTDQPAGGRTY